ncbi:hypothetical protein BT96DRAFT_950114 [Gymnopus androsaceus JB14]|uniref:Uncharacterized protein n=1 Tax=Gymnopus androsaceus JB14 TaxID=1447944 RepID=A0A6A4GI66_9AGAR|nr:hypothetical protein BT96DRAFT_950114 [Gymnopus androsaceus JB14]
MDFLSSTNSTPELDLRCWNILRVYSTTNIGAGEVEEQLSGVFQNSGYKYEEARWAPRMGRIMGTETDDIKGNMANLQWIDNEISGLSMAMFTARSPAGPTPESPSASAPSPPSHERSIINREAGMEDDLIPAKRLQLEAGMAVDPIPEPVLSPSTQNSVLPSSSSSGEDSVLLPVSPPLPQNATPSSGVKTTSTTASSDGADTPLISLRSFDGRVATLFQNIGLFVTTPNMDVIHSPIARCETRMRKFNNFAKDDPLYWPQPYHSVVAHLAVLPCPNDSADHPLCWAWYQPTSADFEPSQITSMCTAFSETIAKLPQEQLHDAYLTRGRNQLRKYIERLSEPGAQNIVSLQLTCLQRVFLESYAHSQWLEKWVLRLHDVDTSFELDPHVMAALDEQLWNHTLPLCDSDAPLNVAHEDPPHPLIYSGLPSTFTRYARMSIFVQRQFASSLIGTFGTEATVTPSTSFGKMRSLGLFTTPSQAGASADQAKSSVLLAMQSLNVIHREWIAPVLENKPVPDKQKTGKLPRGPLHEERNRFLPVTHECFPVRVHLWDEASRRLAELQRYTGPSLLEHYLPDPSLFVNPSNLLKPALILSWLRIRPVILWQLGLPDPRSFKNKDWRAMLEAADNFLVSGSKKRGEMLEILKALVKESHSSGIVINEHNLSGTPAYWKGWPGEKPDELRKAFPNEEDIVRMREVEEALANYYALDIPCYFFSQLYEIFLCLNMDCLQPMPNCVDNWAELPFQTSEEKYNSKSAGEEGLPTLKNIMKCFDLENTVTYMARTARLNVAGLRMVISDNALSHRSFFEMKGIRCRAHLANLAADDWLRHASGENSQSDYEITEVD